jgi:hypothetical protein
VIVIKKIFVSALVCCLSTLIISTSVYAAQIMTSKTVTRIFSEGENGGGFYTAEGLPECKWGIMYINLSTNAGKAMMSQLLTAKSAGFKVVRIDYAVSSSGSCSASGLHIQ